MKKTANFPCSEIFFHSYTSKQTAKVLNIFQFKLSILQGNNKKFKLKYLEKKKISYLTLEKSRTSFKMEILKCLTEKLFIFQIKTVIHLIVLKIYLQNN